MALTTPIVYNISAFDATNAQVFTFNVLGGSQVVANTLTIKDNATLTTIYSQTQTTYKFEHTLPAGTLSNGTYYQAIITTSDTQGNVSSESAPIQFYCYTQPQFAISNMPDNNVIANSSFSFNVTYNQAQGEILNAYVFNLYSASGVLISTSNTLYNASTTLPLTVSYLFSGFEDKASYSIEVTGVTSGGTQITTGRVNFTTSYTKPDTYSFLFLTNNCNGGYITIESNIIGIDGKSYPSPPNYIHVYDDDYVVDLRTSGSYVLYDEAYIISGDFTARLWAVALKPKSEILRFSTVSGDILTLTFEEIGEGDNTVYRAFLRVVTAGNVWGYTTMSKYTLPYKYDTFSYYIGIRKISNIYQLEMHARKPSAPE